MSEAADLSSTSSTHLNRANVYPIAGSNPKLATLTWVVTLLISTLPDIILIELTGSSPTWLIYARLGLLLLLVLGSFIWHATRPLRNYWLIMMTFFGLMALRSKLDFTWSLLQSVFGNTVFDTRMQAEQTGKLMVAMVMLLILLILGYRRRDFFLTRGNLRAPINPVPLLGFPRADPWPKFGLQWGLYIALALATVQYLSLRPDSALLLKVLPILPSILFYAALNAFNEEFIYRAPMLTTLERVTGSKHALWLSAYFFGIAHYYGTPGGISGGMLSIFMGWILGKGMVETRGFVWTWWIHFLSDIAIFTFLTLALLR